MQLFQQRVAQGLKTSPVRYERAIHRLRKLAMRTQGADTCLESMCVKAHHGRDACDHYWSNGQPTSRFCCWHSSCRGKKHIGQTKTTPPPFGELLRQIVHDRTRPSVNMSGLGSVLDRRAGSLQSKCQAPSTERESIAVCKDLRTHRAHRGRGSRKPASTRLIRPTTGIASLADDEATSEVMLAFWPGNA
jgi:hypothetical protein